MQNLLLSFTILSVVIVFAAMLLTRAADRLADATGLGHSLAGLLLLAMATSLPELSVGWAAVRIDAVDLTVGELLGSCLWNLLLLAILDLVTRSRGAILGRGSAAQALTATVSIALAAVIMLGIAVNVDVTILRLGPASWAVLIAYVLCVRLVFKDHGYAPEVPDEEPVRAKLIRRDVLAYIISAALIFFAAPQLAVVAEQIAESTGLGDTFIGVSMVALVTSLPEAVTTFVAIRLGRVNMAVANIFGSNAFNLVILAGVDFATPASLLAVASESHLVTAAAVILVTAVAVLGLLYRAERRFWLLEPDAILVIVLIVFSLLLVFYVARPPAIISM